MLPLLSVLREVWVLFFAFNSPSVTAAGDREMLFFNVFYIFFYSFRLRKSCLLYPFVLWSFGCAVVVFAHVVVFAQNMQIAADWDLPRWCLMARGFGKLLDLC